MRVLVLLLVIPSLLVPPGLCVCGFVEQVAAAACPDSHGEHARGDTTGRAGDCQNPHDSDAGRLPPGKHAPGCPDHWTAGNSKLLPPQTTYVPDLSTPLPAVVCPADSQPQQPERRAVAEPPAVIPVYISLCSFSC
jgi:hypothetical protein